MCVCVCVRACVRVRVCERAHVRALVVEAGAIVVVHTSTGAVIALEKIIVDPPAPVSESCHVMIMWLQGEREDKETGLEESGYRVFMMSEGG